MRKNISADEKFKIFKKYKKYFNENIKLMIEIDNCIKKKCKKEHDEFQKYKNKAYEDIYALKEKERKTKAFKDYNKKREKIDKDFKNNKDVIQYIDNIKNNVKNDNKLVKIYKKTLKKYNSDLTKISKEYNKTITKKEFKKNYKKMENDLLFNNIKRNELSKCTIDKCYEIYKKNIILIKKLTTKLCKEKYEKSCKILNSINKLNINKINYKEDIKLGKLISKKGFI